MKSLKSKYTYLALTPYALYFVVFMQSNLAKKKKNTTSGS